MAYNMLVQLTNRQAWLMSELFRVGVGRYKGRTGRMIERLETLGLVEYDLEPMANCGRPINIYVVKLTAFGKQVISGEQPKKPETAREARIRRAMAWRKKS